MSNHPLNRDRITQTQQTADKVKIYYTAGLVNPNAQSILENNTLWSKQGDTVQAGSGGGLAALAETALNAYMTRQNAKLTEKQQEVHALQVSNALHSLQLISKKAIAINSVQATFVFRGSRPLTVLAMTATSSDGTRVVSHAIPPIMPGQQFTLTFEGKETPLGQQVNTLKFGVDDAAY